jgi:hypothetical protein
MDLKRADSSPTPLPTQPPPPCKLPEGSLLRHSPFPCSFSLIGLIPSESAPQILYKPSTSCLITLALKMETACFSKTLISTCETTGQQNARQQQLYVVLPTMVSVLDY